MDGLRGRITLSTSEFALTRNVEARFQAGAPQVKKFDNLLIVGVAVAFVALCIGLSRSGVGVSYFLQPSGIAIVLGGTLGITLVTAPRRAVRDICRSVRGVLMDGGTDREQLLDDIVQCAQMVRRSGLVALERSAHEVSEGRLREALLLGADVNQRSELQSLLESEVRLRDRQGEMDARMLEVAGGFAPTMGILGTVIGLIDVLRHFSDLAAVGSGIGTAFVSTIYGLGLANLVLLPLAARIRASTAEEFETREMILEGVLAIIDREHPSLIRRKLSGYLRGAAQADAAEEDVPLGARRMQAGS